eukprot:TRINITY_DN332_c0_g1_i4.p1 TRINITY_DN332_c0_g1~~TRINITY_DN332_c0_g1_i4.p1  ORF type:complete len:582 (+),score=136.02 TRINITY_DN332_c0_g1_i4:25-1770(+)
MCIRDRYQRRVRERFQRRIESSETGFLLHRNFSLSTVLKMSSPPFIICLLLFLSPVTCWLFYDPAPWGTSNGNIEKSKISGFRGFYHTQKDTDQSSIITTQLPFTVKKIRSDQGVLFATGPMKTAQGEQKVHRISAISNEGTIMWSFDAPAEIYIAINFKFELLITYNTNDTFTRVEKRKVSTGEIVWYRSMARVLPGPTLPKNNGGTTLDDPLAIEVVGPKLLLLSDTVLYWGLDENTGKSFWERDFFPFDLIESPTPVTALSLNGFHNNDNLHSYFWSKSKSNILSSALISALFSTSPGISRPWEIYRFEAQPIPEKDLDPRPQVLYMEEPRVVLFKFNTKIHLVDAETGKLKALLTRDGQYFTVIAGSSLSTVVDQSTNATKYSFYVMTKNSLEKVSFLGSLLSSEWKVESHSEKQQDIAVGRSFLDKNGKLEELIHVCDGDLRVIDHNEKTVYPRLQGCNSEIVVTSDSSIAYINGTNAVSILGYQSPPSNGHVAIIVILVIVFVVLFGFGVLAYFYIKKRGGLSNVMSGAKGGLHFDHGDDHRPLADDDDDFDIPSSNNNNNNNKPKGDFFREGSF